MTIASKRFCLYQRLNENCAGTCLVRCTRRSVRLGRENGHHQEARSLFGGYLFNKRTTEPFRISKNNKISFRSPLYDNSSFNLSCESATRSDLKGAISSIFFMQYISLVEGSSLLIYAATIINYPIPSTRSTYHFLQLGSWIVATQYTTWNVFQMIEVTKVYLRFCSQPFVVVVPCGEQTFRHWTIIGVDRIWSHRAEERTY